MLSRHSVCYKKLRKNIVTQFVLMFSNRQQLLMNLKPEYRQLMNFPIINLIILFYLSRYLYVNNGVVNMLGITIYCIYRYTFC